jgi:hypothetical protein
MATAMKISPSVMAATLTWFAMAQLTTGRAGKSATLTTTTSADWS